MRVARSSALLRDQTLKPLLPMSLLMVGHEHREDAFPMRRGDRQFVMLGCPCGPLDCAVSNLCNNSNY